LGAIVLFFELEELIKDFLPLSVLSHLLTRGHHPSIFANLVYAIAFTDSLKQSLKKRKKKKKQTTPLS